MLAGVVFILLKEGWRRRRGLERLYHGPLVH
jgi:hypothetical protein